MTSAKDLLELAKSAEERGDHALALSLLRQIAASYPHTEEGLMAKQQIAAGGLRRERGPSMVRIVAIDINFIEMVLLFTTTALAIIPGTIILAGAWYLIVSGINLLVTF